jgi:hypothetical protein
MLAAPAFEFSVPVTGRRTRLAPLVLSVLLHLVLAVLWLGFPVPRMIPDEPPAVSVELVPPAPLPPAPASDGRPEGGASRPDRTDKVVPQLQEGELARQSTPPPAKEAARPGAVTAVPQEKAAATRKPAPVTQSERDFVLSQVVRQWKPPRELAAYDRAEMSVAVMVRADGFFADIYDARRPANPAEVFDGYGALHPQSIQRRTIDAIYQAIRKAQPLRLPDALKAKAPFTVRLDFRFRDVR